MPRGFSPGLKSHNDLDFGLRHAAQNSIRLIKDCQVTAARMLIDDVVIPSNARNLS